MVLKAGFPQFAANTAQGKSGVRIIGDTCTFNPKATPDPADALYRKFKRDLKAQRKRFENGGERAKAARTLAETVLKNALTVDA